MSPQIIIGRSRDADAERRAFEDRLARALTDTHNLACLLTPHLYDLPDAHPARKRLMELKPPLVVTGWMWPRPLEWVVRFLRDDFQGALTALDLREWIDPDQAATAIAQAANDLQPTGPTDSSDGATASVEATATGAAIEDLSVEPVAHRWYPVIDYIRCADCGQCLEFCLFHVYDRDAPSMTRVATPDNCKPGCPACSRVCPHEAIMFPHYDADRAITGAPGTRIAPLPSREKKSLLTQARAIRPAINVSGKTPPSEPAAEAEAKRGAASAQTGASEAGDDLDRLIDDLEDLEG